MKQAKLPPAGPLYKSAIAALIGLLGLTILLGVVLMALDPDDELLWQLFSSSGVVALCFVVITAVGAVVRRRRLKITMTISTLATGIGTGITLVLIWSDELHYWAYRETAALFSQTAATCLIVGVGLAHNGVFSIIRVHSKLLLAIKILTMVCLWACAALILSVFWLEALIEGLGGGFGMLITLAIVGGLLLLGTLVGTIVVPIAAISPANRPVAPIESVASRLRITLECPKCGQRQEMGAGNVRCAGCKTGLFIEVEEPRCVCGYLLYQLRGDRCPECGRETSEADRWAAPV